MNYKNVQFFIVSAIKDSSVFAFIIQVLHIGFSTLRHRIFTKKNKPESPFQKFAHIFTIISLIVFALMSYCHTTGS